MNIETRFSRYRTRILTAGMVVLLITGCSTGGGGGNNDEPTPTATVWPTAEESVNAPASPNAVEPWQMSGSATAVAPTVPAGNATPGASLPNANHQSTPAAQRPVSEANNATPETGQTSPVAASTATQGAPQATSATNAPVVHQANPETGDGTGGHANSLSGTPQASPGASPAASPGAPTVATSCDFPDAPAFTGSDPSYITTSEVNIRIGPGTDCDPAADILAQGTLLQVTSDPVTREGQGDTTWVRVTVDGIEGWVATDFIVHDS